MDNEIVSRIIIYLIIIACFLLPTLIIAAILNVIIKKFRLIRFIKIFMIIFVIQAIVMLILFFHPVITYDKDIPKSVIQKNDLLTRDLLSKFSGFYSYNIPIFAYRYHVTYIDDKNISAEIYYLPGGDISIECSDGIYNQVKHLTGL